MAQTGNRDDPFTSFNFIVEIDGVTKAGFSECSGLSIETDAIDYRVGKDDTFMRKIPGMKKFGNITFKRGFTLDDALWKWRKEVLDGKTRRCTGSITLLNEARQPVLRWTFREAWPRKLDGPTMNAKNNEIAIEALEIVVEDISVETT
jgi:phage tail-like protein